MKALALIAASCLSGCSLIFSPSDLMGGDADGGTTTDTGTRDGGGTDAPPRDAPGTDAPAVDGGSLGCPPACTSAPSPGVAAWRDCTAAASAPGILSGPPSGLYSGSRHVTVALRTMSTSVLAYVGVVNSGAGDVMVFDFRRETGGFTNIGSFSLSAPSWTTSSRLPEGVKDVELRTLDADTAYVIAGGASGGASGIWVGTFVSGNDGTTVNLGGGPGGGGRQEGPLAISVSPPRYHWNEYDPDRQVGTLPVYDTSGESFRRLTTGISPAEDAALAADATGLVVAASADPSELLLWNGDGPDKATSGVPQTSCTGAAPTSVAVASVGRGMHVVGWSAGGSRIMLARLFCDLGPPDVSCCVGDTQTITVLEAPRRIEMRGMPGGGLVVAASDSTGVHLHFLTDSLEEVESVSTDVPGASMDDFAIDTIAVGGTYHVAVAQVSEAPSALELTDVSLCP